MSKPKKYVKMLRGIWGALLTIVLLPFMGVACVVLWMWVTLMELWDFAVDFWESVSDPGYCRVNMSTAMARERLVGMGANRWAQGDKPGAIALWRRAASMYSTRAMMRLAQCYEAGEGVEQDFSKAYECYSLAETYHNEHAEKECDRLKQYAMDKRQRAEFLGSIWEKSQKK